MSDKQDITYRLRWAYTEDDLDEAAAEIERLRSRIAESERDFAAAYESQRTANQAEIERLRAADVLMVAQFESQEREITMLRGLLREWRDRGKHDRFYTTDFEKRVREALGE